MGEPFCTDRVTQDVVNAIGALGTAAGFRFLWRWPRPRGTTDSSGIRCRSRNCKTRAALIAAIFVFDSLVAHYWRGH